MTDFETMTIAQLQELHVALQKELAFRQETEMRKVKEDLLRSAKEAGLKIYFDDASPRKSRRSSTPGQIYRNPANPEQTWGGRGKRPRWLTDLLAGGRQLAELVG